jgi:3-oxoacyl-[acyl-carrier protein] reductase
MSSDPTLLTDRVALVTGASRGIGRAIAVNLARQGANVALVARSAEALAETRGAIEGLGRRALVFPLDVADPGAVNEAVSGTAGELGGLDILVNNAGLTRDGLLMRMSDEDWDQVLNVDLKGVFYFCRAAARILRKSEAGRIINISSVVGMVGNAGQVNYAAAKAGIFGLTRSLAKELGSRGITVNAIAPGFIDTDMTSGLPEEIRANSLRAIPLRRFGTVEDIAEVVAFLCGDAGSYVTGAVIPVDGGMSLGTIG